jgi:hypothetical protein
MVTVAPSAVIDDGLPFDEYLYSTDEAGSVVDTVFPQASVCAVYTRPSLFVTTVRLP